VLGDMPKFITPDEYSRIAYEVITESVARLTAEFRLTGSESGELQGHFVDILVTRLLPRDTRQTDPVALRAQLRGYYAAARDEAGRPRGAGWQAARIIGRRALERPDALEDAEYFDHELADPYADVADVLERREQELQDLALAADEDAARERTAAREAQRVAAARQLLAEIGGTLSEFDRRALADKAAGLTFRAAAQRELAGPADHRAINARVKRYHRAWKRLDPDVAARLRPICPEPERNPRKGHA
jgi:hypothetical protein